MPDDKLASEARDWHLPGYSYFQFSKKHSEQKGPVPGALNFFRVILRSRQDMLLGHVEIITAL